MKLLRLLCIVIFVLGLFLNNALAQLTIIYTTQRANFNSFLVQNNNAPPYAGAYNNGATELAQYANQNPGALPPGSAAFETFNTTGNGNTGSARVLQPGDEFSITCYQGSVGTGGSLGVSFRNNTTYTTFADYITNTMAYFILSSTGWTIKYGTDLTESSQNTLATPGSDRTLKLKVISSTLFDATIAGTTYKNLSFNGGGSIASFCLWVYNNNGVGDTYWKNASLVSPYTTAGAGDWETGSTWIGGNIPTAGAATVIAHAVTCNTSVTNALTSITVNSGASLTFGSSGAITTSTLVNDGSVIMTSGGTLNIAASGSITNNGTFTSGTGNVSFANGATINGTTVITFNNFIVNLGGMTLTTVPHIAGILQLYSGYFATPPIYDNNSTLRYNAKYSRYKEWNAVGTGTIGTTPGYPNNVIVANDTLFLQNFNDSARACAGNLTVNSGAALTMSSLPASLTVDGNVTIDGTLTLSNQGYGDLKTSGNVSFGASSIFNSNGRAIWFTKNGMQTLTDAHSSITIPYIGIGKSLGTGTTVQMIGTDVTVNALYGGTSIEFVNSTDVLDLNGSNLSIGTTNVSSKILGNGTIKGNVASSISIIGSGACDTLNFTSGSQVLHNLTINRTLKLGTPGEDSSVVLGTDVTINGTLTVTNGDLITGSKTVTLASTGTLSETASSLVLGNVFASKTLATSVNENFGNIGVEVNTLAGGEAPGLTTVTRVTGTAKTNAGRVSIKRYFTINPANNPATAPGLNATLKFHYNNRTAELNGIPVDSLTLCESSNSGTSWDVKGGILNTTDQTVTVSGLKSLSLWTLGNSAAPLPVELTSFSAKVLDMASELTWATATEINNYGFEIQRSNGSTNVFEKIGFVNGAGNSNAPKEYSFRDKNLSNGKYNYRLKQVDFDGKFEYSKSIEVFVDVKPKHYALDQNYPNPFNPSTKISFSIMNPGLVSINIFNAIGQIVNTINKAYSVAGTYNVDFNGSNLPSGLYFYKLQSGNFSQTKKMLLVK